jgi:hypothetical protein
MNFSRHFKFAAIAIGMLAFAQLASAQTAGEGKIANMTVGAGGVRWDIFVANPGGSVTVSFPDGRSIRKAFKAGSAAEVDLSDKQLEGVPDGVYNYEIRLAASATGQKRPDDDESETQRNLRKRSAAPSLSQSGSFAIANGVVVGPGAIEGQKTGSNLSQPQPKTQPATVSRVSANTVERLRNHRFSLAPPFDIVQPDDVIIQGSLCVGFDCVNNESFGFDTIRLKENSTRIKFEDTSVGSFPSNDWQLTANDSASGGANKFSIEDITGSKVPFTITAGAATNSIFVDSTGRLGLRTSTPVLDIHAATSNTPGLRLEQNNSGGFTAQTWDVAGNEANFFVRDITSGSRLPFRIRPGAPTSSIDINASGNVGVGTASPTARLDVRDSGSGGVNLLTTDANAATVTRLRGIGAANSQRGALELFNVGVIKSAIFSDTNDSFINGGGRLGINTATPDQMLSVNGDADKAAGGGSWGVFSDERLKDIKGGYSRGLKAVMGLRPIRFSYKKDNAMALNSESETIGFSAQELQKVVPEAVSTNSKGFLVVHNDPILWTMLNAIQEQQKEIASLKAQVQKLQARPHRRHKK